MLLVLQCGNRSGRGCSLLIDTHRKWHARSAAALLATPSRDCYQHCQQYITNTVNSSTVSSSTVSSSTVDLLDIGVSQVETVKEEKEIDVTEKAAEVTVAQGALAELQATLDLVEADLTTER